MDGVPQQVNDEIDLMELFQTVWDGKWKIVGIAFLSLLSVVGFQFTQPPPSFVATTEIKPINSVEAERYTASNAVGFFEVMATSNEKPNASNEKPNASNEKPNALNTSVLLDLYIEILDERKFFEDAIRKFGLLDRRDFEDDRDFNDAIIELAASIEILPPSNVDGKDKKADIRRYWELVFEFNDDKKWKDVLSFVTNVANDAVRQTLITKFDTSLLVAKQKMTFEIEDLSLQIENALSDYDRKTSDRLEFLKEQAAIARKLGVAKNTIEAQTFSAQNGMFANVKTDTPFYLRGYDAIEKEIELIESRKNKEAFANGLLELEQKKRALEQDKTLERAESLFALTPITSPKDFSAVSVSIEATDFEYKSKRSLMMALALVVGGMIGVMYVLISNAVRNRRQLQQSI